MPDQKAVKKELLAEFPGIEKELSEELVNDFAAIGALLSNEGAGKMDQALEILEQKMFALIESRFKPEGLELMRGQPGGLKSISLQASNAFTPKSKSVPGHREKLQPIFAPYTKDGTDPYSRVLSTVLGEFEKKLRLPGKNEADEFFHPRYVGFVQSAEFLANVAHGKVWKDVGASPEHGEFTHRLQWFVAAYSNIVPPHRIGEIYRAVGTCPVRASHPDGLGQTELWARLVDRPKTERTAGKPGGTISNSDLRCPEYFNKYVRDQKAKLPLLSTFLDHRFNKRFSREGRGSEGDFMSRPMQRAYCGIKLFGKAFDPTGQIHAQKQAIDAIVGPGDARGTGVLQYPTRA